MKLTKFLIFILLPLSALDLLDVAPLLEESEPEVASRLSKIPPLGEKQKPFLHLVRFMQKEDIDVMAKTMVENYPDLHLCFVWPAYNGDRRLLHNLITEDNQYLFYKKIFLKDSAKRRFLAQLFDPNKVETLLELFNPDDENNLPIEVYLLEHEPKNKPLGYYPKTHKQKIALADQILHKPNLDRIRHGDQYKEHLLKGRRFKKVDELMAKYSRPLTILYVSNSTKKLEVDKEHIVVYWNENRKMRDEFEKLHPQNVVLLTSKLTDKRLSLLTRVEHFDIAILDAKFSHDLLYSDIPLADYTYLVDRDRIIAKPKSWVMQVPYPEMPWSRNLNPSESQKYYLKSTFNEKTIYSKPWTSGICYRTYLMLKGRYPTRKTIKYNLVENYLPFQRFNAHGGNLILQGSSLRNIDFNYEGNKERDPAHYAKKERIYRHRRWREKHLFWPFSYF